jgi:hypothetical protein
VLLLLCSPSVPLFVFSFSSINRQNQSINKNLIYASS